MMARIQVVTQDLSVLAGGRALRPGRPSRWGNGARWWLARAVRGRPGWWLLNSDTALQNNPTPDFCDLCELCEGLSGSVPWRTAGVVLAGRTSGSPRHPRPDDLSLLPSRGGRRGRSQALM